MRNFMLIIHFLGLAMGVGTGIAYIFLGKAASKLEKAEAIKFALNTLILRNMGLLGISLLVISGVYLIIPFLGALSKMPYLVAKLVLVVVLITLISISHYNSSQALKGQPEKYMPRLRALGPFTLLTSLAIIILAVISFH
jgi:uncharacterized membrane protein